MAERREVRIVDDDVTLAGSVWLPVGPPHAGVAMHPGSGGSDRDNDGYFVPLRNALLGAGYAVVSFDKRGVGDSSGRWQDAPIETQGRDLIAAADRLAVEPEMGGVPIGFFGHSQGGWVALDAAARRPETAFVILNSGPGVSPASQERYAARMSLEASGADPRDVEIDVAHFDLVARLARAHTPFAEIDTRRGELGRHLPWDESLWHFWISILDYEPRVALGNIHAPILTLWGGDDRVVPVEESIAVFRSLVPPTRLTVEVFPGADHRIQVGEPLQAAPGHVDAVLTFLDSHSQS